MTCVAAMMLLYGLLARAAADKIDLQQFHPAATASEYFGLDSPGVLPHLRGAAGLVLSEGANVLLLRNRSGAIIDGGKLVANQVWLEALGSVGFFDWFELGLALPIALYQGGADGPIGSDLAGAYRGERGAALGDLRVDGKVLLLDHVLGGGQRTADPKASPHRLRLSFLLGLTLPTSTTSFSGEGNVSGRPRLAFEWAYRRLRLAANFGAVFRARARILDLDVSHQLTWGVGLRVLAWRGLEVLAEARGVVGVAPPRGGSIGTPDAPTELDVGLAYATARGLRIFAAGGFGIGEGYGAPAARFIVGARYTVPAMHRELPWAERDDDHDGTLNAIDRCVREAGPKENEGCPDGDLDADGVLDRLDRCPDRAGIADNAGCPDYDTDGDNIPDRLDRCPKERGFAVSQGCPAQDSDHDGVPDTIDRCPTLAGVAQNDGCPDTDSDGDGLVDRLDKCPFDAEVYNGVTDDDGCPDAGVALAEVVTGQIAIFEPLVFEKDGKGEKLSARSQLVLSAVAALMKVHTGIVRVRVDGHTDNRGGAVENLDLSLLRAQLVRRVLVERWKIDPKRLTAQGFGGNRPLVDNATLPGRNRNRRIEFTIVEETR